jgi:hypothetical protein
VLAARSTGAPEVGLVTIVDARRGYQALTFLKDHGRLVAIISAGVSFRKDKKTAAFREFVREYGGTIDPLPDSSFQDSGLASQQFSAGPS